MVSRFFILHGLPLVFIANSVINYLAKLISSLINLGLYKHISLEIDRPTSATN